MDNPQEKTPKIPNLEQEIAAHDFTPADIEHLVSTAQERPSEFETEVQDELDRLERARKA